MSKDSTTYIRHILDELDHLVDASSNLDEQTFKSDDTRKRAFIRSLEIVGEATKQLPQSLRDAHSDIPWAKMAPMRDVLIHDYLGIDYDIANVTGNVVRRAVDASVGDFEDAVLHEAARRANADLILTRNAPSPPSVSRR